MRKEAMWNQIKDYIKSNYGYSVNEEKYNFFKLKKELKY
jgi:hypothetical protein